MPPRRQAVTIVGLDDVLRDLAAATEEIQAAAAEAVRLEAEAMADDMRSNVRVSSGDLKAGLDVKPGDDRFNYVVGVHTPELYYAQYEEFGTSLQPGHPFMVPAAERSKARAPGRVSDAIRGATP